MAGTTSVTGAKGWALKSTKQCGPISVRQF